MTDQEDRAGVLVAVTATLAVLVAVELVRYFAPPVAPDEPAPRPERIVRDVHAAPPQIAVNCRKAGLQYIASQADDGPWVAECLRVEPRRIEGARAGSSPSARSNLRADPPRSGGSFSQRER